MEFQNINLLYLLALAWRNLWWFSKNVTLPDEAGRILQEADQNLIIYLRVPKTGSTSMEKMLR